MNKTITLGEFIMDRQAAFPFVSGQLTRLLTDIGVASKIVNHQVNRAGLAGILGGPGAVNIQDEAGCFCRPNLYENPLGWRVSRWNWIRRAG